MRLKQFFARVSRNTLLLSLIIVACFASAQAQVTAFTFQGRLNDSSTAANGSYDLQFTLYDSTGAAIGSPVVREDVQVTNGIFTIQLDFGALAFDGTERTLEIAVRRGNETSSFTTLSPRQSINSTPYAIRALTAINADNATNATNATNSTNAANSQQLGGVAANQFVQTDTTSFVRNQTAQQSSTNFNISGTGEANIFNATTQFSIGGTRVLSAVGTDNIFVGRNTGVVTTAGQNTFLGVNAGQANAIGSSNSFIGFNAGLGNTKGAGNSFVGRNAGFNNTLGSQNSFFGRDAGVGNTTGDNNTVIGNNADVATGNLSFATALGSEAVVSTSDTIVLGKVAGTYNSLARPADNVQIPGNLAISGNTSGTNFSGSIFNATTQYNLGGNRVLSVAGTDNLFAGVNAGTANTTGNRNSFIGFRAGEANTSGSSNSFVGTNAGLDNTTGIGNSFFGVNAGINNTTSSSNSFFGFQTGINNITGGNNTFVGSSAGQSNIAGSSNTLIGASANVGVSNLTFATAIGAGSVVRNDNTIVLGREEGSDKVRIYGLGSAGSTSLCRNANNEISTCTPGSFAERRQAETEEINTLREQVKQQQLMIDELKKIVCSLKPNAAVCKEK